MKRTLILGIYLISIIVGYAQNNSDFEKFRQEILNGYAQERQSIYDNYQSFRNQINADYANFLRNAWSNFTASAPIKKPVEPSPTPPVIYEKEVTTDPVIVEPKPIETPKPKDSPKPVVPIEENNFTTNQIRVKFYGLNLPVRVPNTPVTKSTAATENEIGHNWNIFSDGRFENTLFDLSTIKKSNKLCDWAYLQLVDKFASTYTTDSNTASLLTAWILCQSGFQIRIARDNMNLYVLYASNHTIFDKAYYFIDGMKYYPIVDGLSNVKICNAKFKGETPLSLTIPQEQVLGVNMSNQRTIRSSKYSDLTEDVSVNNHLIDFYNSFPTSAIGGNTLSRWAIYANTPFSSETAKTLYPRLKEQLSNCTKLGAVERLLNWVQTGLVYGYDDKVWGHDRAFFAEETLFYPYCDCEDRSILFSRLVRDLVGLDVALIYYPGHIATAVCFNESIPGTAMIINGKKFIVCDPTFIGAPVGSQMPNLEHNKAQALILKRP